MPVTFHIPGPLRALTGGESRVEVPGTPATLREALESLWAVWPAIRDRLVTEQGDIREHINLFVGSEDVRYTGGFATLIPPVSEITIIPAISGGCRSRPRPGPCRKIIRLPR